MGTFKISNNMYGRSTDERISFALCSLMFLPAINNLINSLLQIGFSIYLEFLTPCAYIFMAFLSVFVLYKHILRKRSFLFFFLILFFGVMITYLAYPEIQRVLYKSPVDLVYSPVNKLFFYCIPALIGVACLYDADVLFDRMCIWARFTCALGILTFYYIFFITGKTLQYMVYSYFMLLPICVCYEHSRLKRTLADLLLAIAGTACIVACGARGAIISLVLYSISRAFLIDYRHVKIRQLITFTCIIVALVVMLLYYDELLLFLVDLMEGLNIDSRIIMSIYNGELLEDSGRTSITNTILEGISKNPFGYGLFGDRYVTGLYGDRYRYAHNIFIEVLCDFGVFGGSMLILVFFGRFMRIIGLLRIRNEFTLIMALLPYGFFQLLFSSSFLENIPFFMIIGLLFFVDWKEKIHKQEGKQA